MTTYVGIGTEGPRTYTRAEIEAIVAKYQAHIKPGTQVRITDEGDPTGVGDVNVYDGTDFVPEVSGSGGGSGPVTWTSVTGKPTFATVATSGAYADLSGLPTLFSGSYLDLSNRPSFAAVAFTGEYADLADKPVLFSGAYTDLSGKPTLFSGSYLDLSNVPTFATVATSGSYPDLVNRPALSAVATSGAYTDLIGLPTLFSGSYNDLTNLPILFDGQYTSLTGKPNLATVATSGAYSDLAGLPSLSTVAHTGLYTDIIGTPPDFPVLTNTYFVSKNGDDSLGDGSMAKPFATLQKAHDTALSTNTVNDSVVIIVYPGSYEGALTWSRPRTTIYGFAGSASATSLNGQITITSTIDTDGGSPALNLFGFQNVLFGGTQTGDAINMTGTVPATLVLDSVKFASTVAGKRAVFVNITNATKSIMHWTVVDSNMGGGGTAAFDLTNVNGYARQFSSESNAMPALYIRTGRLFINGGGFESNGGGTAAVVVGDGSGTTATFQASNVYVLQDANNNDAVSIAVNGVAILDDVQLDASGTGFAVNGVAGGQFEYAYLTFGGGSTKVAAALTSIAIPTTPTFV